MDPLAPPPKYPWWVRLARTGSRSRTSQWFWFTTETVIAVLFLYWSTTDTGGQRIVDILIGVLAALIAVLSIATIRWMDQRGDWSS